MTPNRFVQAVFYPLTEMSVLLALLGFWLLLWLAAMAGILGMWLAIVVVPAVFRYQLLLLEARARGREPQPPGAEFFNWVNDAWTLFPAVVAIAIGWAAYAGYSSGGLTLTFVVLAIGGFLYPAVIGVLAITHSPLQSINPVALYRFVSRCGLSYGIAPVYLLLIAWLIPMTRELGPFMRPLVEMFFVFSLHSVIGAVIEPRDIVDDVYIPEPLEADDDMIAGDLQKLREGVLAHAYGFISRDNREGGFRHVLCAIEEDPDPVTAWDWYFNSMFGWENTVHALFFAQHYIHDALRHGEDVRVVKAILRCRLVNQQFKPLREDIPAAIEAANKTGNSELAEVLRRG